MAVATKKPPPLSRRQWRTPPAVAKLYQVDPSTVRWWIESGQLRAINVARPGARRPRYRISLIDLAAFENSRAVAPKPRRRHGRQRPIDAVRYF
jgi:hypothetical protein